MRYGGDEFVLVLPEIKEDGLVEKLQEIQEKIQNAVIPGYSNIQLSVSMGAVISQNESVEHAMLRAHKLMYQAKNKKNTSVLDSWYPRFPLHFPESWRDWERACHHF